MMISQVEIDIIIKLLLAFLLGAIIGIEREFNKSIAGIKTYSIICIGSALFTLASATIDARIAAGVITGIGFLGAATIFKTDNKVIGVTTAALIWIVAAIGFTVGLGLYFAAITTTIILLLILIPLEKVENKYLNFDKKEKRKGLSIK